MATGLQAIGTPGHSPALKYELQLAEIDAQGGKKQLTEERIDLCFSIFDDLIPQLGVFQRIMKMLRNELYDAVYSNDYTAGIGRNRRSAVTPVRVPHFVVAKRIMLEKDKHIAKLKGQIESLKEQLYNCDADLEKASSALEASKYNIKENEAAIQSLTHDVRQTVEERNKLQSIVSQHQEIHKTVRLEGENKAAALENLISSLESQVKELQIFKATHQQLQKVFSNSKQVTSSVPQTAATSQKTKLQLAIDRSTFLGNQLLLIQNKLIDEYEVGIVPLVNSETDAKSKLKIYREKFKTNNNLIEKELHLLSTHENATVSRMDCISKLDPNFSHLAVIQSDHPASPLTAQEQLLCKYSSNLLISTDEGLSYYECNRSQMCLSCGVMICPHWTEKELVIQLPLNTTHIKLTRPPLQITSAQLVPQEQHLLQVPQPHSDNNEATMDPDFNKIWHNFLSLHNIRRSLPRELSLDTVKFLIKLFYASQLKSDQILTTDTVTLSLSTSFYQFMKLHYHISNIGLLVSYDMLKTIQTHYQHDTELYLFSHTLAGSLDGVVFRYYLLMADFVYLSDCDSSDSFIKWAHIVYPFMEEEGLDQLNIEYIAYCQNHLTKQGILDYILRLLWKHREPLLLHMESYISDQKTLHTGSMNEHEFAQLAMSYCNCDVLAVRLFSQTLAQLKEDGRKEDTIPFRRLAYILSYIHLLWVSNEIYERLKSATTGQENATSFMKMSDINKILPI